MAVAQAAGSIVAAAPPKPWWRGRSGLVLAVAVAMVVAFFGWKSQAPWPAALTWNGLAHHLDSFQTWLSDRRNVPDPSIFFQAFNGLATFLDNLVGWLSSLGYSASKQRRPSALPMTWRRAMFWTSFST